MASVGWRKVARISGVNGSPGGKIELIAGVRGSVLEGPQEGPKDGAATARAARASTARFIEVILKLSSESKDWREK